MGRLFVFLFFLTGMIHAQHQDKVDFINAEVFIKPDFAEKKIEGSVSYSFEVLQNVDSVYLDASAMNFSSIRLNGKKAKYAYDGKHIIIHKRLKGGKSYDLFLDYHCQPKQAVYFLGQDDIPQGNEQIWTQGQGKYTSHWLPSFDDMEEKVEFDLNISMDKPYVAVANGRLIDVLDTGDARLTWVYDMQKPMSSYLLAFAIGTYETQEVKSESGVRIQNYYYPQDSLKVEPTYRYTKEIFDFMEAEIGVPYPWQNYKQIPVRDFLYAGMENTGATIFSDGFVIDSTAFVDKNYVNVNAHELAHQWFGNLVTEKDGNHHWLHEGFATYYAYLAEKQLFGDDHFYWKLYNTLQQLQEQAARGEGQSLLDPKASSLTFYEKGAWALFMLRHYVGDTSFKKGIEAYLRKYAFKNVTVDDFLNEMRASSGKDLAVFKEEWLISKNLPIEKARQLLADNSSAIKLAFEMEVQLAAVQSESIDYSHYWDATNSIHLKKRILTYNAPSLSEEIIAKAFESDTLPVRQALLIAKNLPKFLTKNRLESLLEDASYATQENAFFLLWQTYPEDRVAYLEKMKAATGFPNKNIRLLWLTLAMLSENYMGVKTRDYFDELTSYTSPEYAFELRQSAFFYLKETFGLNDRSLTNLVKATNHHSWQFKKYARNLVNDLLEDPDYKKRLEKLGGKLNEEESRYLLSKLKTE